MIYGDNMYHIYWSIILNSQDLEKSERKRCEKEQYVHGAFLWLNKEGMARLEKEWKITMDHCMIYESKFTPWKLSSSSDLILST